MAVIYQAELAPTKPDVVTQWLDSQGLGDGPIEVIGSYRFDDPAGEVGVEAILVRRGDATYQVPLTYRGAPLPGAEAALICTMEHSVLGDRWVHHAAGDPVAVECFTRALTGAQQQAPIDIHHPDGTVERTTSPVRVALNGAGTGQLALTVDTAAPVTGNATLVATWNGGEAVVAALR